MMPHRALVLLTTLVSCSRAAVKDGQYYQDFVYRLSGSSVCWPSDEVRRNYTDTGHYEPRDVVATRFQSWRDRVFVATPRFRPGVPFTLGKFDLLQRCFPCLQPFPSWDYTLHNVVDLVVDTKDLLWVLDTGVVDTLVAPQRLGPPRVVAFDAFSGKEVHSIDLSSLTCAGCRPQYLLVDYCRQTATPWVYVSDAAARAVLVHDVARARSHRVLLPEVTVQGGPRDVLYMSLVARTDRPKRVYFTYLSSDRMFSMTTLDLRNTTGHGSVTDEGGKPASVVLLGGVDNNIMFRYKRQSDIMMWDVDSTFKERNFIPVQQGEEGRQPNQVCRGYGGLIWVLESNYMDYLRNTTGCLGASSLVHPLARR